MFVCGSNLEFQVWDLTANKSHEIATDGKNHPIQSLSMATNASVLVGANNKGTVFVFSPGGDTKAREHWFAPHLVAPHFVVPHGRRRNHPMGMPSTLLGGGSPRRSNVCQTMCYFVFCKQSYVAARRESTGSTPL